MSTTPPIEQPVRRLQEMLHVLSLSYPQLPPLAADGIFGEHTLEAVMIFQRDFHPPVTGVVDRSTWKAIHDLYLAPLPKPRPQPPFLPIPDRVFPIRPGARNQQLYLVQSMLDSLADTLSGWEPTEHDGVLQGATQSDIQLLQTVCGLPATGTLDFQTWSCLTRLYRIFAGQTA